MFDSSELKISLVQLNQKLKEKGLLNYFAADYTSDEKGKHIGISIATTWDEHDDADVAVKLNELFLILKQPYFANKLETIDLIWCPYNDANVDQFVEVLKNADYLNTFSIGFSTIDNTNLNKIIDCLKDKTNLEYVGVNNIDLSTNTLKNLLALANENENLNAISFDKTDNQDEERSRLINIISSVLEERPSMLQAFHRR